MSEATVNVKPMLVPLPAGSGKRVEVLVLSQCVGCCVAAIPPHGSYACAEVAVIGATGIPLAFSTCWRDWSAYLRWVEEALPIIVKAASEAVGAGSVANQISTFIQWVIESVTSIEEKAEEEDKSWMLCTDKCQLFILSSETVGVSEAYRWCAPGTPCVPSPATTRVLVGGFQVDCPVGSRDCYVTGWDGKRYDIGDKLIVAVVDGSACGVEVTGNVRVLEYGVNTIIVVTAGAVAGAAAALAYKYWKRKRMGPTGGAE